MSLGCYLEFINRSFKSITVSAYIYKKDQWDKNGGRPDTSYDNKKIQYYESNDMEMKEFLTNCDGEFFFYIQVEKENGTTEKQRLPDKGYFNLNEGRKSTVRRDVYNFVHLGFFVQISRGKDLRRIGDEQTDYGNNKGIFKVEVFSCSQKRLAIITDPHLCEDNRSECNDFKEAIVKLQKRPDFIVMCGDLTGNNYSNEKKIVEHDLIKELEARNFSVCEGLGNHDVRHFTFDGDMMGYIKKRNRCSDGKLSDYFKDQKSNLHYHWAFNLCNGDYCLKVHCFMLNLVPGYRELGQVTSYTDPDGNFKEKSKDVIKVEKDERNPFYSLDFFETQLSTYAQENKKEIQHETKKRNVALVFFHINYESENAGLDGYGPERWWPFSAREDFARVINNNKECKVIGSFFGHNHGTQTRIETLDVNGSLPKPEGFKVAAFLTNTTFLDLEFIEENKEYILKGSVKYLKTNNIGKDIDSLKAIKEFAFNFNDL
ncbi:metallophosphoesterase family protein [Phocaeicola sp.]